MEATKAPALDGELFSTELTFQEIVGIVKKEKIDAADVEKLRKIKLWCYDVVMPGIANTERLATLTAWYNEYEPTNILLLETFEAKNEGELKKFHDQFVAAGHEGLIIRNKAGVYKPNVRSADLQKYKEFTDDEYESVGFTDGEGVEKGLVIWECTTKKGQRFNVRPRGTHEERAELFRNAKRYVGKMLTVRFQELTDDGVPRFPVGIGLRDYE